jgi:hypothetical protein
MASRCIAVRLVVSSASSKFSLTGPRTGHGPPPRCPQEFAGWPTAGDPPSAGIRGSGGVPVSDGGALAGEGRKVGRRLPRSLGPARPRPPSSGCTGCGVPFPSPRRGEGNGKSAGEPLVQATCSCLRFAPVRRPTGIRAAASAELRLLPGCPEGGLRRSTGTASSGNRCSAWVSAAVGTPQWRGSAHVAAPPARSLRPDAVGRHPSRPTRRRAAALTAAGRRQLPAAGLPASGSGLGEGSSAPARLGRLGGSRRTATVSADEAILSQAAAGSR